MALWNLKTGPSDETARVAAGVARKRILTAKTVSAKYSPVTGINGDSRQIVKKMLNRFEQANSCDLLQLVVVRQQMNSLIIIPFSSNLV
jgi:hypothetical protein